MLCMYVDVKFRSYVVSKSGDDFLALKLVLDI